MKPNGTGLQLEWGDALATGIGLVDEQHQRLIAIYNEAAQAQSRLAGDDAGALHGLLEELLDYSRYHFREEARLMREWDLDAAQCAAHLQAHERFVSFLQRAQIVARDHPEDAIVDLLAFLAQWLLHHIAGVDARMARAIRSRQAAAAGAEAEPAVSATAGHGHHGDLVDVVSQLTDTLGQKTFDLIDQRQKLLELQELYRSLLRSGDALIQSRSEHEMIDSVCERLAQDTPFHAVWVGRPAATGEFEVLALAGDGAQQVRDAPPRLSGDETASVVAKAWNRRDLVVCNDTLADASLRPWHAGFASHQWLSLLAVPVWRARQVWCVLAFAVARRDAFDARTVEVCTRVAALLGFGLDELDLKNRIQSLQEREARMARTDALTQLPNRLAVEEYLPRAIARARRQGLALVVGMLDLDDFKPVNDRFGHAVGDALLQRLASLLRANSRQTDFLARLGGDEFVIVFEDLDPERMRQQLEAMLARVHVAVENPFDLGDGRTATVGMSMGLASYPSDAREPDALLRLADAAMYASKARKSARDRWWRFERTEPGEAQQLAREDALDPFDSDAAVLLGTLAERMLDAVSAAFVAAFYDNLAGDPELGQLLRCLRAEEFDRLRRAQDGHLRFLLSPRNTPEALHSSAQAIGRVHALVGVSSSKLVRAFALYEDLLRAQLEAALLSARQRYRIIRVATARLRLSVQGQLAASDQTIDAYAKLLDAQVDPSVHWTDALQRTLDALAQLPGVVHAIVYRPDEHGAMHIEAGAGRDFAERRQDKRFAAPLPALQPGADARRGPLSMAWFSRRIQVVDAYLLDPRLQPWHGIARALGWRSAATIPICGGEHVDSVLMLFGSFPRQFSSDWARHWLDLLQGRFNTVFAAATRRRRPVQQEQTRYFRELLYDQRLRMWVQPIVDLSTGRVSKVEALARLQGADAQIHLPGQFLAAFGEQELHALFRQGLRQSLRWLHDWREAGLEVDIGVNLPIETLLHRDCANWVESALRDARVAPQHLSLEVLEDQDADPVRGDEAIHALSGVGVRLALDDLGSGYSSLNRLASLPIDTVKIDQGLIRQLPRDPLKTIRLLASVLQIGQDFAPHTVVEGLEDDDLIEVAQLLGAQLGQGYGLARPMPAETFAHWATTSTVRARNAGPQLQGWPAALAYHWRGMRGAAHPAHNAALATCPLSRFLRAHDAARAEVSRWHEIVHSDADDAVRSQASEALLAWLDEQVRVRGAAAAPR